MEFKIGDRVVACYIDISGVIHYYYIPQVITKENKLYWITDHGNKISKKTHKPKGCAKYDTAIYVLYTPEM